MTWGWSGSAKTEVPHMGDFIPTEVEGDTFAAACLRAVVPAERDLRQNRQPDETVVVVVVVMSR